MIYSGYVVDADSGEGLTGANISFVDGPGNVYATTTTITDGWFGWDPDKLSPAAYLIVITRAAYQKVGVNIKEDFYVGKSIQLQRTGDLSPVTVTAPANKKMDIPLFWIGMLVFGFFAAKDISKSR